MGIRQTVLGNGVTVVTEHMPGLRSAALGFWVRTGSVDEAPGQEGLSHFMEHMLFKGTPSRSAIEISMAFDALGAELNAFTAKEHTCFYARMVDKNLPACFEILSDMLVNSSFAEAEVQLEREVVLEELASSEDMPDDHVFELFSGALFPGNPLGRPVLGRRQTVSVFSGDDLRRYHRKNYVGGNVVVVACGNVSHDEVACLAGECLVGLPGGPSRVRAGYPAGSSQRLVAEQRDGEQAHIVIGCPAFGAGDRQRFAWQVVDSALGGTMSSRLFNEVREKRGLVYSVYSESSLFCSIGQFEVYAATRPDNIEQVVEVIGGELDRMAREGMGRDELERVREMVCGTYVLSMESPYNHMVRLGKMAVCGLEPSEVDATLEAYRSCSLEDIDDAARCLLSQQRTVAVISPFEEGMIERMVI